MGALQERIDLSQKVFGTDIIDFYKNNTLFIYFFMIYMKILNLIRKKVKINALLGKNLLRYIFNILTKNSHRSFLKIRLINILRIRRQNIERVNRTFTQFLL